MRTIRRIAAKGRLATWRVRSAMAESEVPYPLFADAFERCLDAEIEGEPAPFQGERWT